MFDLQIDKKKKKCHQWISCEKKQNKTGSTETQFFATKPESSGWQSRNECT
jgi:hypothetical protein